MSSSDDPVLITHQAYETGASAWAAAASDRQAWRPSYELFASAVSRGSLVLDLGCGAGHDAPGLSARGLRLVGLDISAALLRLALHQPALSGRIAGGDMRAIPFRDGVFDAVWADGSLHHVPKAAVKALLGGIARVLRPKGVLFASIERGRGEGMAFPDTAVKDARYYALYQRAEWSSLLQAAGFELLRLVAGEPSERSPGATGWLGTLARKP